MIKNQPKEERLRVVLIASVRPELTSAASLTLYRHLVDRPEIDLSVHPGELFDLAPNWKICRLLRRLEKTRFAPVATNLEFVLFNRLHLHRLIPTHEPNRQSIVLTLAYRNGWRVARDYALHRGLPLVAKYDDWWPDMAPLHPRLKHLLECEYLA